MWLRGCRIHIPIPRTTETSDGLTSQILPSADDVDEDNNAVVPESNHIIVYLFVVA